MRTLGLHPLDVAPRSVGPAMLDLNVVELPAVVHGDCASTAGTLGTLGTVGGCAGTAGTYGSYGCGGGAGDLGALS